MKQVIYFIVGLIFFFSVTHSLAQQFLPLINITNTSDKIETEPALAVDKNNHVHIVYTCFYAKDGAPDGVASDIYYTNNIGGQFSPPQKISVDEDWYSREPCIAVDSHGFVHIAFRRSTDQSSSSSTDDIYYVSNENGDFGNPTIVADGVFGFPDTLAVGMPYHPRIACDSQNNVILIFYAWEMQDGGTTTFKNIVCKKKIQGQWQGYEKITSGYFILDHKFCLDSDDNIHLAYNDNHVIFYITNKSGNFSQPERASSAAHDAMFPDIAVDSHGTAHIVYRAPFVMPGTPNIIYTNNKSGTFDHWEEVSDYSGYDIPSIAVDDSDFVHITYKAGATIIYGNNFSGEFRFISHDALESWESYRGSRYFALGDSSTLHFTFWQGPLKSADVVYFKGYTRPVPTAPNLVHPYDGAKNISITPTLRWQKTEYAQKYHLQLSTDISFANFINDEAAITDTTFTAGPLENSMTYFWRVKAVNAIGASLWSETFSFTTIVEMPAQVNLIAPTDHDTTYENHLSLIWHRSSPEVIRYQLQYADNPDMSESVNDSTISDTTYYLQNLNFNITYYWRVRAKNAAGWGPWSETWQFTVRMLKPQQVVLISPTNNASLSNTDVEFIWKSSQPAISRYWLEYADNSSMTNSVIDSAISDTTVTIQNLERNKQYFWRVRAQNASGWGPFSEIWQFSIISTGVESEQSLPTKFALYQNFPNPFNQSTTIQFDIPHAVPARMRIYDLLGHEVKTLIDWKCQPGSHSIVWHGRDNKGNLVNTGTYFLRMEAGQFVAVRKVVLLK